MATRIVAENLAFFLLACACLLWARWRTLPGPVFPGPRPVGPGFRAWLLVIWLVGLALPLAALGFDGLVRGRSVVLLALLPYFAMFFAQVGSEIYVWKRWRSPIWVIIPCLYLPWRVYQQAVGLELTQGADVPLTRFTLAALLVLWIINVGVHYTNIVNTLRWDAHPHDARFAALRDPRVFTADAQDPE
jgi:hypothetical protein